MEKVLDMKEINDEELAQAAGGAARTETRTAKKEVCECCGRNQFTVYLGMGGRAVCQRCGHGQIILERFYD